MMTKKIVLLMAVLLSGCAQLKEMIFYKTEQHCSLKQNVCEENFAAMKSTMDKYKAEGVAYVIMDMNTSKVLDEAYYSKDGINYNEELKYSPSNLMNMFYYAGGLHYGYLEPKDIKLNTIYPQGLKKVSKENKIRYLKELNLETASTPLQFLLAYNKVMTNPKTKDMAKILKENVERGAAQKAYVENLDVCGLTTTMNKAEYSIEAYTTFIGHFNKNNTFYSLIVVMDNPKPLKETFGYNNAGWNVAVLAQKLIKQTEFQDNFAVEKK